MNFVYEFGVNIHMRRTQGRSAKGDSVYRKVSAQKGPNVTICCAVSTEGLLHYQVIQGGMEKVIFKNVLEVLCGNIILDEGTMLMDFAFLTMLPGTEESKIWTSVEYSF